MNNANAAPNISGAKFIAVDGENTVTFIRPSKLSQNGTTGIILEGTYLGSEENGLDEGKLDYAFETELGKTVLNGCSSLARQMVKVAIGDLVQIEYLGKNPTKDGKKSAHKFIVRTASQVE